MAASTSAASTFTVTFGRKNQITVGIRRLHDSFDLFRLTVTYAVVLLLTAGLMGSLGTGPQWYYVKYRSEDCRAYWWTHLLYLNNYIPWHTTYVTNPLKQC